MCDEQIETKEIRDWNGENCSESSVIRNLRDGVDKYEGCVRAKFSCPVW